MNPLVERLGWVLVHSLWQFALVALLAGGIVRALRRSSAATRYGVLAVAMAVLVIAPLATWLVSSNDAPDESASRRAIAPGQAPNVTSPGADAARLANSEIVDVEERGVGSTIFRNSPRNDSSTSETDVGEFRKIVDPTPERELSRSQRWKTALRPWLAGIVAVWSLGVVVCSLRPLLGGSTLWRLKRVSVSPASDDVLAAMRRVSERLSLRRAVRVLQSTLAQVPVVVGYLRPVVLLPVSLMTSLPAEQLEAILAHELAHVRRHDFVVNLLQTLIETLFFYHPAVWWLSHQIRVEREHCCDDLVVTLLGNRIEYGRALVAIAELRGQRTVLALGAADGSLLSRVRRIVGIVPEQTAVRLSDRWPVALVTLGCLLTLTLGTFVSSRAEMETPLVDRAGRGSPDPALDPTAGLPNSGEETNPPNNANGDLRPNPAAGSGDTSRTQDDQPAPSLQKRQTFQEVLATRPAPNLTTLVERSLPKTQGTDASESFLDLLKLRESADASAVPVLEKTLIENRPTTRIHGFAAAQALFAIGTPEAHQILARNELSAHLAVDYTSHWEMQEPLRSRYIERYLLKNVSNDLVVELQQTSSTPQSKGHLNLVVVFRNASDVAFFIHDDDFPGDMLHLRDATGQFIPRIHNREMCPGQSQNIELKPGQTHRAHITIDVTAADSQKRLSRTTGQLIANVRESGHYFDVNAPGRFEVLALFEAVPLTNGQRTYLKVDQNWKWWTGRAVSKPLSINIATPAAPTRAGRGSPDPALDPTAGLPESDKATNKPNNAKGDLRSDPAAGSGDPRRAQDRESIRVVLKVNRKEFLLGESIAIDCEMTNDGTEEAPFGKGGFYPDSRINDGFRMSAVKVDESDKPVGKPVATWPMPQKFGGPGGGFKLKPNKTYSTTLLVTRYLKFQEPGRYRLRVENVDRLERDPVSPYSTGEMYLTLKQPTPEEARGVFERMKKAPRQAYDDNAMTFLPEAADFQAMHQPIYLPILKEFAAKSDRDALQSLQRMERIEASEVLVATMAGALDRDDWRTARVCFQHLKTSLPFPNWFNKPLGEYDQPNRDRVARLWKPAFVPTLTRLAKRLNVEVTSLMQQRKSQPLDTDANDREFLKVFRNGYFPQTHPQSLLIDIDFIYRCVGQPEDFADCLAAFADSIELTKTLPLETNQYFRPRGSASGFVHTVIYLLERGAQAPNKPTHPGEAAAFAIALRTQSSFRPAGWQAEMMKWLKHDSPYLTELVLGCIPDPIPNEVLDYLPTALAHDYIDLQIAACHVAKKHPRPAYREPLQKILDTAKDPYLRKYAVDAARANGLKAKYDPDAPFVDQATENPE